MVEAAFVTYFPIPPIYPYLPFTPGYLTHLHVSLLLMPLHLFPLFAIHSLSSFLPSHVVLLSSFKPQKGVINSVTIYPSDFGKERLEKEDILGPAEIVEDELKPDLNPDSIEVWQ